MSVEHLLDELNAEIRRGNSLAEQNRTLRRVIVLLCLLGLGLVCYAITGNTAASILGAGLGGGQLGDYIA